MAVTISNAAIVIAGLGFLLAFVQFINRLRPFVSVGEITLFEEEGLTELFLGIHLTSAGEVPAANVTILLEEDPEWPGHPTGEEMHEIRELGVLFPDQSQRIGYSTEFDLSRLTTPGWTTMGMKATISYQSPIHIRGMRRRGYGFHMTYQPLYRMHERWGNLPGSTFR